MILPGVAVLILGMMLPGDAIAREREPLLQNMQQYIVIEEVLPPSADMAVPSTELAYVTMAGAASR